MEKINKYDSLLKDKAKLLRSRGKTYPEISIALNRSIPKSTLSGWCKGVNLPSSYYRKLEKLTKVNREKARKKALEVNRKKRMEYLNSLREGNLKIAELVENKDVAKIALAMLCLGEASKYSKGCSAFCLGSTDPKIILLFLELLRICFGDFDINKIRCRVQCRADQDIGKLESYWRRITKVPKRLFYKAQIDPRTVGKPTRKKDYKGVLRVDYFNNHAWLDLEALSDLIFDKIHKGGPVV